MFGIAPDANIIDINHQVPRYSIRDGVGEPRLRAAAHAGRHPRRGRRPGRRHGAAADRAQGRPRRRPDRAGQRPADRGGRAARRHRRGPGDREPRPDGCRSSRRASTAATSSRRSRPTSRWASPFESVGPTVPIERPRPAAASDADGPRRPPRDRDRPRDDLRQRDVRRDAGSTSTTAIGPLRARPLRLAFEPSRAARRDGRRAGGRRGHGLGDHLRQRAGRVVAC